MCGDYQFKVYLSLEPCFDSGGGAPAGCGVASEMLFFGGAEVLLAGCEDGD